MAGDALSAAKPGPEAWAIDRKTPHAARIYAYYLGATTWFEVDRVAADKAASVHPGGMETVRASVRSNRAFLIRVVTALAGELGVDQFLDIGSGIPNGDNVHDAALRTNPAARTVYVDNDSIVLAHAHQLLRDAPQGTVEYLPGDLRHPDSILQGATRTLDFTRPVVVLLVGILHFLEDEDDPYGIVGRLMSAVRAGSYLVVCHLASDIHPEEMAEVARRFNEDAQTNEPWVLRSHGEVARFFDGLELVGPGVVQVDDWRPHDGPPPVLPPEGRTNPLWVGVGRKP